MKLKVKTERRKTLQVPYCYLSHGQNKGKLTNDNLLLKKKLP